MGHPQVKWSIVFPIIIMIIFYVFINDLCNVIKNSEYLLFVKDVKIFMLILLGLFRFPAT